MFDKKTFKFILAFMISLPGSVLAGELDLSGFVGTEVRAFTQDSKHLNQKDGAEISAIFNPEFRYSSGDHRFSFIPFYRHDSRDDARSHFDIREAYWLYIGDDWEILTGINKVFWGVTESRHLVNIINQTDAVEDLDGEDYLGQPMVNFSRQTDMGRFDLYALPGFRERTYPGTSGRFRGDLVVDTDNARYESGAKEKHVDFAVRWSHYFGDWDVGLSHFYGTSREPRLIENTTTNKLEPNYDIINQTGLDVQYTNEAWLWKFEGIAREGQGNIFTAATGGFEYTFYQAVGDAADIGVLTEYHYDGRNDKAPAVSFDHDYFAGIRLSLNDIQDTSMLAGASFDPNTGETSYSLEAERRIGVNYKAEIRARFFTGSDEGEGGFGLEKDDYLQLRLSRYF